MGGTVLNEAAGQSCLTEPPWAELLDRTALGGTAGQNRPGRSRWTELPWAELSSTKLLDRAAPEPPLAEPPHCIITVQREADE
ncbi:MAG: hypothetical protein FWH55_12245 [Oscillospiraceae bacterium]|nr:hypothetical protein [Oscillospiraceae bacterium]